MKIEWKQFKIFKPQNKHQMKHAKFSAILGRDVKVGETLNAEDLVKISAALGETTETTQTETAGEGAAKTEEGAQAPEASATQAPNSPEATANPNAALEASIASAVSASLAPINQKLTEMSARLAVVEGSAGAKETINPVVTGDAAQAHPWEDPNSPLNQKIAADLGE
jgi:hypothetical protein